MRRLRTLPLRLNCAECNQFREWEEKDGRYYCEECGQAHSEHSLRIVHPDKEYERAEDGTLLEVPP